MTTKVIRSKSREEWLKVRQMGLGSSEIGTAAGLNPYESRYELWERKTGRVAPKEENEAMAQGHELEDFVAQMFARHAQKEIIKASAIDWQFQDIEHPWRLASPDRTYWLNPEHRNAKDWTTKGILECKTTNRRDITPDNLPDYWFAQVQWQLGVGGMTEAFIAWVCKFGCTFDYTQILFNADVYSNLCDIADEFYNKNIKEDIAPVEMRAADIQRLYPTEKQGEVSTADNDLINLIATYHTLAEKAGEMEAQIEEIKDKVIVAVGASEKLVTPDGVILATYKAPKPSLKLDSKAFKADAPDIWAKYAVETQGARRLIIK